MTETYSHPERSLSRRHRDGCNRRTPALLALPLALAVFLVCASLPAQTIAAADPPLTARASVTALPSAPSTPTPPAERTFHDPTYHLSFDYPSKWTFSTSDGEISTFHLDARSAPSRTRLRAVVASPENPFPASTFSGAYLYFSVVPHTSASACAKQAKRTTIVRNTPRTVPGEKKRVADVAFTHGHDEQRDICIVQRDEIYTTRHSGSCYRFDLSINNFCGGEVSGVKDITAQELDQVRHRLETILATVRFDPK